MNLTKPKNNNIDVALQLLGYLAEKETFAKAQKDLGMTRSQISNLINEVIGAVKELDSTSQAANSERPKVSERALKVISKLSQNEEQKLLRTFKIA